MKTTRLLPTFNHARRFISVLATKSLHDMSELLLEAIKPEPALLEAKIKCCQSLRIKEKLVSTSAIMHKQSIIYSEIHRRNTKKDTFIHLIWMPGCFFN